MMLSNPRGALRNVSDYRLGVADDGDILHAPSDVQSYPAALAVSAGAIVAFRTPTATQELRVGPMISVDDDRLFAGVAVNSAPAGEIVQVVRFGHALALVEGTPAFGDRFFKPTTAGVANSETTDPDATDVIGAGYGVVLGNENPDTGLTPVFVRPV